MSEITFRTVCTATLIETWRVQMPDDFTNDDLMDKLFAGDCEFLYQETDDEADREFVKVTS